MRKFIRSVVLLALVGGWALASSAVYVVRTPGKVLVFPKNQLGYKDTFVDTRAWTITQDREHPALVARVIQLNRTDALAHTVNSSLGPVNAQLAAAVATSTVAVDTSTLGDKAKAELKSVSDGVKAKLN
jgi:hypothetical protein